MVLKTAQSVGCERRRMERNKTAKRRDKRRIANVIYVD